MKIFLAIGLSKSDNENIFEKYFKYLSNGLLLIMKCD